MELISRNFTGNETGERMVIIAQICWSCILPNFGPKVKGNDATLKKKKETKDSSS